MPERRSAVLLSLSRDDERRAVERALARTGMVVRPGEVREEVLNDEDWDVVVVDERRLDPDRLARWRYRDRLRGPAVVAVTDPDPYRETAWLEAGADDVLVRPLREPAFGARISAILRRRQRERELRRHALRDPLTGLANRALIQDRLAAEIASARRHGGPLSLALLDLDGFKAINDRLGHPEGDRLLARVGECLRRQVRADDLAGRYGGDEFLVLMPRTALRAAHRPVSRLVRTISELHPAVTCSAGLAALEPGIDADELVRRADRALYVAKRRGGNQVVAWTGDAG